MKPNIPGLFILVGSILVGLSWPVPAQHAGDSQVDTKLSVDFCNERGREYNFSGCKVLPLPQNYCGSNEARRRFNDKDSSSTFVTFVSRFYCALANEERSKYEERIAFPLPFISRDTEGTSWGIYERGKFRRGNIIAVDGRELPLAYAVGFRNGYLSIKSDGTGMARLWNFELINGKWMLVGVDQYNY